VKSFHAEVTESARLYGSTHVLWAKQPAHFGAATPGQFVMTYIGESHDPLLGRAMSVHRLRTGDAGDEFALLFDVVGQGTDWLSRRSTGDLVRMGDQPQVAGVHFDRRSLHPLRQEALEFRRRYDGEGMLHYFREQLVLPHVTTLRQFRPLIAQPGWLAGPSGHSLTSNPPRLAR
jgi:hypothetical protein